MGDTRGMGDGLLRHRSLSRFFHAAAVTAKFHFVPNALPLFPPGKWTPASDAYLFREMLFLHAFHFAGLFKDC